MKGSAIRWTLYLALAVLYLLHNDLWYWDDPSLVLGLPIGLFYHVIYCLACAGLMWLVARYGWPKGLDSPQPVEPPEETVR